MKPAPFKGATFVYVSRLLRESVRYLGLFPVC